MSKVFAAAAVGLAGFLMTGCFDIEQTLTLERNMSGKAGFTMKVNMEPIAAFMAQMQREMAGQKGPPTQAEIDKARQDFRSTSKPESSGDFEKDKREMESKLPKGVTLLQSSFKEDGLKVTAGFVFGFDQASKLSQIKFPKKKEPSADAGPGASGNPVDSPFGDLQVIDEGRTLLVTNAVENPVADQKKTVSEGPPDPEMAKQVEALFGGLRVAFRITAPFEIVEHNAHRKEGTTLIWEFDMKSFNTLTPEQLKQGVRVRYKK